MCRFLKISCVFICIILFLSIVFLEETYFAKQTSLEMSDSLPVLIIDAGHGGIDGGTSSKDGILESDLSLLISLKTKYLCDFLGIKNIMTRYDENSLDFDETKGIRENKILDTKARTNLVNSFDNAFLLSIHLNSFPDESVYGAQIFYNNETAKIYADILNENLKQTLDNDRITKETPSSVYLTKNSNHPAVIFEAGFLSNASETEKLIDSDYQKKLAMNLVASYY